jgi:hypothetical protein
MQFSASYPLTNVFVDPFPRPQLEVKKCARKFRGRDNFIVFRVAGIWDTGINVMPVCCSSFR